MGKRMFVAEQYKVKYSYKSDAFKNSELEKVQDLLQELGCNLCEHEDDEFVPFDYFEIERSEFDEAITQLELICYNIGPTDSTLNLDSINKKIAELKDYTTEDLLHIFHKYQKYADTSDGYYHFKCF